MERLYETHPSAVEPGKTTQLSLQMPAKGTLKAFIPDKGLSLKRVIAGRERISPNEDGTFTFGQTVDKSVYVVAVVGNDTRSVVFGQANWLIEADDLPDPKSTAQVSSGIIPPKKKPAAPAQPKQVASGRRAGQNELTIFFTYGEAKRLAGVISGGSPIVPTEAPPYLRKINQALAEFSGEEAPEEPAPSSEELDGALARIDELEQRISTLNLELREAQAEVLDLYSKLELVTKEEAYLTAFTDGYRKALKEKECESA